MLTHEIVREIVQHAVLIEAQCFEYRTLKARCDGLLENHQDATVEKLEDVFAAIDAQVERSQTKIDELSKELSRIY